MSIYTESLRLAALHFKQLNIINLIVKFIVFSSSNAYSIQSIPKNAQQSILMKDAGYVLYTDRFIYR